MANQNNINEPNSSPNNGSGEKTGPSLPPDRLNELDLYDTAVELKHLFFTYDKSKDHLLNDITLTFPRSAIYGFLGPSGCGKTTVIKLIVGRLNPVSGKITVNGKERSHPNNKIPGVGVGYMPQDFTLYNEFTIYETLNYFAKIYGLSKDFKNKRIDTLIKFFELPDQNRLVGVLSGGQKRRTSLAVAIIHNPPLLILDEPTCGVDPVLRERIWEHLVDLSANEKTSILITTHYIEECRRAHIIALMRGGKLLVENSPSTLLSHFKTDSLEDVFLQVCKFGEQNHNILLPPNVAQVRASKPPTAVKAAKKETTGPPSESTFIKRFFALSHKNVMKLWRQKLMCLIVMFLPTFTLSLACICIGKKPFDLDIAVYNQELDNKALNITLSVIFLDQIDKRTINQISYSSNESAIHSVRNGDTHGAIVIHHNFTAALMARSAAEKFAVSNETLYMSTIHFFGDLSDLMIYQVLFQTLMEAEIRFTRTMISQMPDSPTGRKSNPESMAPLVKFIDPPVYGSLNPLFINFGVPGLVICVTYVIAMALTSINIVMERKDGLLDRTIIAGAKVPEILVSELWVQHIICVIQIIFLFITIFLIFDIKNEGNVILVFVLALIQGTAGMGFGLFISSIAESEESALMLVVGSFVPYLVISGIVWPLEGMHFMLRTISLFTPQTLPVMAMRNIMLKGWGLSHTLVWAGYLSTIFYIIVFMIMASIFTSSRSD